MGKERSAAKERYWRKLIQRQSSSGEKTAAFCRRVGVPAHQFWWWRRTLRDRDAAQNRPARGRRSADPVHASENGDAESAFVPVRVPCLVNAPIEVVHPQGYVVRVPPLFDPVTLRRLLTTLDPLVPTVGDN